MAPALTVASEPTPRSANFATGWLGADQPLTMPSAWPPAQPRVRALSSTIQQSRRMKSPQTFARNPTLGRDAQVVPSSSPDKLASDYLVNSAHFRRRHRLISSNSAGKPSIACKPTPRPPKDQPRSSRAHRVRTTSATGSSTSATTIRGVNSWRRPFLNFGSAGLQLSKTVDIIK